MKFHCFAFSEVVSDKGKITPVCRILDHEANGQMVCAEKACRFYKTHEQYNARLVERKIVEYATKHK